MNWTAIGAWVGLCGVGLGAYGAHGLEHVAVEGGLAWWRTAVLYQLVHAPVLLFLGQASLPARTRDRAGWALLGGVVLFCGTLYAMALGAPTFLGALTPLGGLALMAGWGLLALGARAARRDRR